MNHMENILEGYKVGELKELAKIAGISGYSKLKKAELIEAIAGQLETIDVENLDLPAEVKDACKKSTKTAHEETEEMNAAPAVSQTPAQTGLRQEAFLAGTRTIKKSKKIYPNDSCPCGSGKKYKKCCGRA